MLFFCSFLYLLVLSFVHQIYIGFSTGKKINKQAVRWESGINGKQEGEGSPTILFYDLGQQGENGAR